MHYIYSLVVPILYYGLCFYAFLQGSSFDYIKSFCKKLTKFQVVCIITILICPVLMTLHIVSQNNFVYYWDYSGYWQFSIDRVNYIFSHNIYEIIRSMLYSINYDDYNCFLPTITALPLKLTGYSFLKYVTINNIMFLIPAFIIQAFTILKLCKCSNLNEGNLFTIILFLAMLFPANYYSTFVGYIDVAILLPISILIYLFVDYDFNKIDIKKDIAISILVVLAWISRRYVIYFLIGYGFAFVIKSVFYYFQNRSYKTLKNILINLGIIGITAFGVIMLLFQGMFFNALLTNYREMYSAYNYEFLHKLLDLKDYFGITILISIGFIGFLTFLFKQHIVNFVSLFALILIETFLFYLTQNMGIHHKLIINVPVFIIIMLVFAFQFNEKQKIKKCFQILFMSFIIIFFICNYFYVFWLKDASKNNYMIFSYVYKPLIRYDISRLNDLGDFLNKLDGSIYITASSRIINSSIINNLKAPQTFSSVKNLYSTYDVDLRDGFPAVFLTADYIVSTTSNQTHLPTGQSVITYLNANMIDKNSYMKKHFKPIKEFMLDNGVRVIVYKKISEWTQSDLDIMIKYYENLYPNHDELFKNRIHL